MVGPVSLIYWKVEECFSVEFCPSGCNSLATESSVATRLQLSFYANESESILLPGTQLKATAAGGSRLFQLQVSISVVSIGDVYLFDWHCFHELLTASRTDKFALSCTVIVSRLLRGFIFGEERKDCDELSKY